MDTRTREIQIPAELLDRVFPEQRLARRHDDEPATPAELICDALEAANLREPARHHSYYTELADTQALPAIDAGVE